MYLFVFSHLFYSCHFQTLIWSYHVKKSSRKVSLNMGPARKSTSKFWCVIYQGVLSTGQVQLDLLVHTWPERILRSKSNKLGDLQCILISGSYWFQKCNRWKYSPRSLSIATSMPFWNFIKNKKGKNSKVKSHKN